MKKLALITLAVTMFGCSNDDCSGNGDCPPPSAEEILRQMATIDLEVQKMISTSCSANDQCMATPYGAKACGGPATFLVHSSNMDLVRFNQLVDSYTELNEIYNLAAGAVSDCALVNKPEVECFSGNCQAVGSSD